MEQTLPRNGRVAEVNSCWEGPCVVTALSQRRRYAGIRSGLNSSRDGIPITSPGNRFRVPQTTQGCRFHRTPASTRSASGMSREVREAGECGLVATREQPLGDDRLRPELRHPIPYVEVDVTGSRGNEAERPGRSTLRRLSPARVLVG